MGLLDSAKKLGKNVGKYKGKYDKWQTKRRETHYADLEREETVLKARLKVKNKEDKIARMRRKLAPKLPKRKGRRTSDPFDFGGL